jgi:DNA polymerase V
MEHPVPLSHAPINLWSLPITVQCGFPSPADDHQQQRLDISTLLVQRPDATFFMRVRGPSMRDVGIDEDDYVVVDRSITPKHGHIVVAVIDGEFTVKQLFKRAGQIKLCAANPTFTDIDIKEAQELTIWGVVTWTLKNHTHG